MRASYAHSKNNSTFSVEISSSFFFTLFFVSNKSIDLGAEITRAPPVGRGRGMLNYVMYSSWNLPMKGYTCTTDIQCMNFERLANSSPLCYSWTILFSILLCSCRIRVSVGVRADGLKSRAHRGFSSRARPRHAARDEMRDDPNNVCILETTAT